MATSSQRQLAEENESSRIPIVALTANALAGEAAQCIAAGMDGYLSKPARLEQLEAELQKWIPSDVHRVVETPAATSVISIESLEPQTQETRSVPLVDVSVLEQLVGDEPAMIHELLIDFRESAAEIAEELHNSWLSNNAVEIGTAAHKLKSAALSVGACSVGELCAEIEKAVREGRTEALAKLLPRFQTAITAVFDYLDTQLLSSSCVERVRR